jgi:hypothetical protein
MVLRPLACLGLLLTALSLSMPAQARKDVAPYLEVGQIFSADLNGNNDVLTYSQVAAGIDASVSNRRSEAQISYRYERRIGWGDRIEDGDIHSGLARAAYQLVPNKLSIEAGALASRARVDGRGSSPSLLVGNTDNVTQVYSIYAGPNFKTEAGPLALNAAYRLAYTKVEADDVVLGGGQPRLDQYDDSVSHLATASVGMGPGELPFGWTFAGAYEREDAGQLAQRFESKGIRGDAILPVSPYLAIVGGVGYEDIEASQRAPLLDVTGVPVVDGKGRFVTDPASPRLLAYDLDGLYWDVGVAWRPSRRTSLEARIGRRYGSMSYTGSFTYQMNEATAFGAVVYDDVQTFGQQLNDNLSRLPTSFATVSNPLAPQFGGCVFGGGSGNAGGCLNPVFQSINSSVYRTRGVTAVMSRQRGHWSMGVGLGYAQRKYETPVIAGASFNLDGVRDESWFGQGQIGYQIDEKSAVDAQIFASLYDSGILNAPNVWSTGATGSYRRTFGRRLSGIAAVGLYSSRIEGQEGDLNASALFGLRYTF